jgi:hypothetical protein
MRRVLLLLLVAACEKNDPLFCQQNPGASGCPMVDGNNTTIDAMVDGDPGVDARTNFGSGAYEVHLSSQPSGTVTLLADINTTNNTAPCSTIADWVGQTQPSACFVVGTDITLSSGTIAVDGSRPLVLVATGSVKIMGTLDVASHAIAPAKIGPAANDSSCGTATAPGTSANGGGGGAGGSFMTKGGNGGKGDNNNIAGGTAAAAVTQSPDHLRGGCPGQAGGAGGTGGILGAGGGALYVVAGATIDLRAGGINASGAAGGAGVSRGGGGGAGAGGMIVLSAPSILTDSATRIAANGGGGGAGATGTAMGAETVLSNPTTTALGGQASGGCQNENGGGAGAAGATAATAGGTVTGSNCGGGGGGGGLGYIQTNVALGSGVFSPAPVVQ